MKKILLTIAVLFIAGCNQTNRITQTSTIDALLAGAYDGQVQCSKLLEYGNFGIGTFDKLDGEMTILNRKVYQIKSDGRVYLPANRITTPFATVCNFKADNEFAIANINFKDVQTFLDQKVPNQNLFLAVKITGKFNHVKTRSVPAQTKPYPPLVEVAKTQPVFEMNNIDGTIVGFRSPPFVKGINVGGYHFHFLSSDSLQGGHVLDFEFADGKCEIDKCNELLLILPENDSLKDVDLSKDKTQELHKVEK
ncbi:MAG: acetolactate decarboxylase [Phycisphaerales bacterium]